MNAYLLIPLFFVIGLWVGVCSFGRLLDFVTEKGSGRGVQVGPWKTHPGVGRRNTPLIEKAAIARIGLGANDSEETIYWNAFTDNDGHEQNNPLEDLHFSIFLSRKTPDITDNWIPLPAEDGEFSLAYRFYRPAADMKENLKAVCMPEIIRC